MVAPHKGCGGLLMSTPPHLLTRMPFHSFIISHLKECISKLITSKLNLSQTTIQYAVHFQPASLVFLFVVVLNEGIYITSELLKWIDFVCLKKKKKIRDWYETLLSPCLSLSLRDKCSWRME